MRCISAVISVLLVATAIFGIYHIVILFSNKNENNTNEFPTSEIVQCDENATSSDPCFGLVMTTRNEWLAQPPHNPIDKLSVPAKRIILSDTKTYECSEKAKCINLVRNIQENHLSTIDDIEYSFLIDTKGGMYEGRGWTLQSAELADDLRMDTYWIAFIGNFAAIPACDTQVKALRRFAEHAVSVGKLVAKFEIYCSLDLIISSSDIENQLHLLNNYKKCLKMY